MTAEIVVVAGFGRCGSTLAMQMLAAGGLRTVGDGRSTETGAVQTREGWLRMLDWEVPPFAVKALDPFWPPAGPSYAFIWLDRDPSEQAKSHAKFLHAVTGRRLSGAERRMYRAMLRRDRPRVVSGLRDYSGSRLLVTRFESLIERPLDESVSIAWWLGEGARRAGHTGIELDSAAMAQVVRRRSTRCLDHLAELAR